MKIEFATTVSDRYRNDKMQNKITDNDNFSVFYKFQTVIKQVHFFRRKMERWIFTSNKNFKFILNQLGYFKEQLFGSLTMKYGFSHSTISFITNDSTYHA